MAVRIVFPSASLAGPTIVNAELSFSDGSVVTGTADIFTGVDGSSVPNSSHPVNFMKIGNKLVFQVTDNTHGRELWVTDGTVAGTEFLVDINTVAPTDTHDSTERTSSWQFSQESVFKFQAPVVFNGFAYFKADDGVNGIELWRTDGTALGTTLVANISSGAGSSAPFLLTASGNFLYFAATDAANGTELWRTDGTTTQIVADLVAGNGGSNPSNPADFNGSLFFTASDVAAGPLHLWQVTGAGAPTQIAGADFASQLTPLGNLLLFNKADNTNGAELWVYDGTTAHIVKNIATTPTGPSPAPDSSSNPQNLAAFNGFVYFWAQDDTHGWEVWRSNGTEAGTTLFADINTIGPNPSSSGPGSPFVVSGNKLYFLANNGLTGQELWVTDGVDGTAAHTHIVKDIISTGTTSSFIGNTFPHMTDVDGTLYFTINDNTANGLLSLYKTNGTAATTVAVAEHVYFPGNSVNPFAFLLTGPVVDLNGADAGIDFTTTVFTENGAAVAVADSDATLTGSSNITGATVTITNLKADDVLSVSGALPAGIRNGGFAGGVLTLTGAASLAAYETAIKQVRFSSTSENPDTSARTIAVAATDTESATNDPLAVATVGVTAVNDAPAVNANTGATVNEGASTTILNAQLDFNDPEQSNAQITYTVTSLTANGTLFRNAVALGVGGTFTQADIVGNLLTYTHNGGETVSDSFGFSVSDGIAPAVTGQTFAITVTPQNDPPVLGANTGATVNEGASTTILNAQLDFNDVDNSNSQITYTVTSLTANGTLFRNAVALGVGGTFTQADIVGNLLSYTHNGGETVSDSFGFSVSDGIATIPGQAFAITVTPQNDPPVQHFNTGTAVNEGAGTTILNAQLDFNDPDNSDAQITYTLTSLTANGTLFRNAVALGVGGTFTQADIVGNLLTYTHNGGETTSDSFGFSVSDGFAPAITGQTFAITVTQQNDPLSITSNGGGATASINLPENATAVTTVTVTDPDGAPPSFSIVGGDDAAKFQIDASSGALSFITAPNFESPADLDHNNTYVVQVRASDGSLSDDQVITVQVGDVTEVLHWINSVDAGAHPDPNPIAHTIGRGLGGSLTPGWLPSGIGDFNNDGTSDIAWYNPTTNNIDIWLIKDGQWSESVNIGSRPAGSTAVGVGDFDHNGVNDITWFNPNTGQIENWLLAYS